MYKTIEEAIASLIQDLSSNKGLTVKGVDEVSTNVLIIEEQNITNVHEVMDDDNTLLQSTVEVYIKQPATQGTYVGIKPLLRQIYSRIYKNRQLSNIEVSRVFDYNISQIMRDKSDNYIARMLFEIRYTINE